VPRYRRPAIALIALVVLVAAGVLVAGGAPAAPTVPSGFPPIGSVPGSKTARFTVIVEGTATALKDLSAGATAPCQITVTSRIEEKTTYQRGKGVVMEFVRLGPGARAPVIVKRAGRKFDASLALKVRTRRTATGSATRADLPGATVSVCDPRTEDLSTAPDCGKTQVDDASAGLLYTRSSGILQLKLNSSTVIGFQPPECPLSEIAPGLDSLVFGWPTPPAMARLTTFLPVKDIFGPAKVLVRTINVTPAKRGPEMFSLAGLVSGSQTNFGTNRVTIRLIRVK
jgi:hypothetical protein